MKRGGIKVLKSDWIKTDKGFFIGDPCYVFDKLWLGIVDSYYSLKNLGKKNHTIGVNEGTIGMVSTMYGDGGYVGTDGEEYSVDSGSLGIVPLEVAELDVYGNAYLGKVIDFKGEARVLYDDGLVTIEFKGSKQEDINIDTGSDEDEYYFEEGWL